MGNIAFVLLLLCLIVAAPVAQSKFEELSQTEDWEESLKLGKEKMTRLHFYFHDTLSGKQPSALRMAQGPNTEKSPTGFGALMMADDPLTEGPKLTSMLVGRAQGLYGSAGQDSLGLIMAMSFSFNQGVYNGSTLSIFGRNPAMDPVREMPIVGGTGIFRLARGTARAKTYWFNATTGDAIVEYNVTVFYYEDMN